MKKITPANRFVVDARVRTGLTQKEFAPLIRVAVDTLSRYETGDRQPTPRVLAQIKQVLIDRKLAANPCSPEESEMLTMFRQLSPTDQKLMTGIFCSLTAKKGKK